MADFMASYPMYTTDEPRLMFVLLINLSFQRNGLLGSRPVSEKRADSQVYNSCAWISSGRTKTKKKKKLRCERKCKIRVNIHLFWIVLVFHLFSFFDHYLK